MNLGVEHLCIGFDFVASAVIVVIVEVPSGQRRYAAEGRATRNAENKTTGLSCHLDYSIRTAQLFRCGSEPWEKQRIESDAGLSQSGSRPIERHMARIVATVCDYIKGVARKIWPQHSQTR